MPVRVDWAQIKSAWVADDDRIVILDNRAIQVLLSAFPIFYWAATYSHSDDWETDRDYIDRIIAEAESALGTAMKVSELVQYFDDVEDLLTALVNHANSVPPCCGEVDFTNGDQYTDPVTDGSGSVPQNIIDAGYATDAADWAGFDDYKCIISHLMIDSMELSLRQMIPLFGSSGEILGGIGSVSAILGTLLSTTGPLAVGIIGTVGAVAGFITAIVGLGEVATEALADGIAANHDELACAIYNADGSEGAVIALKDKIDELFSVVNAALLKNMSLDASLKALYAGRYDQQNIAQNMADAGYDPVNYTCDCDVVPAGDIYGVGWTVQRFNGTQGNQTLYEFEHRGSNGGIYQLGTQVVWRLDTIGGTAVMGTDLDPVKTVVMGPQAALDDASADIEQLLTPRVPGSRTGDYIEIANDNEGSSNTMDMKIHTFKVWVSDDGGTTGQWATGYVDLTNGSGYVLNGQVIDFGPATFTGDRNIQVYFSKEPFP